MSRRPTMKLILPTLGISQEYNCDDNLGEYYQYVHWKGGQLATIHPADNSNPKDDGCPLKKFKPTNTDYKAFDEFVRNLDPTYSYYVKTPEPGDMRDVLYLRFINAANKDHLPSPGGSSRKVNHN